MKSKLTQLLLVAAILGGAISMTSCQGLIDAVLGDHGDNPTTTPTPTPTPTPPTYANGTERPLTFEAAADGVTVTFKFKDGALPDYKKVEYSLDGGATWTALSSPAQPILLKKTGDIVMFRGDNPTYNGDARFVVEQAASQTRATTRVLDKKMLVYLYGNLASLIENRDIYGAVQLKENNRAAFKDLFKDALIDHEIENERGDKVYELILPSIDKSITVPEAFMSLFENTPITHAPVVRVYTISPGTMSNMFYDCPRLSYATFELGAIEDDIKALEEAMGGMLGGTTGTEAEGFFNIGWALDPELENNGDWDDPQPITLDEMTKASGISQDVLDNTIITIINENGKASEAAPFISVTGVEITGSGNGLELIAGENCNLSAKVVPEDASDKSISWSSEDKTIATVDDKGCVTAVSSGTTTIRASHNPYSATITVTVKAAAVKQDGSIAFATATPSQTWSATAADNTYTQTVTHTGNATVTYSINSDNTCGATIDASTGKVTFTKAGSVTVTAKVEDTDAYTYATKEVSYTLTVNKKAGSISYTTATVEKKTTDAAFTNTLTKTGDGKVTYSSNKESVASVDSSTGEVTIKGVGEATITATVADSDTYTYATKTATYKVNVVASGGLEDYNRNNTTEL